MRVIVFSLLTSACFLFGLRAEVKPVSISAPETTAWTGELVLIVVELRANGSFSGSASFDIPEIPGTLLVKTGNPVVGSKELEGESWFIQTHQFALFSQKSGTVVVPPLSVRFEAREGFTGPAKEISAKTDPLPIEIRRPPGSEDIPFLVTTESLSVSETWDPVSESAEVGDVFRRTIVQTADGLTGMALLPASTDAPEGVRVYPPKVETSDNTERGAFNGERRETLTYLLQQDGAITLPELSYSWWNPKSEKLESKTLPGLTIQVAPAPVTEVSEGASIQRWVARLTAIVLIGLLVWQRQSIAGGLCRIRRILDPPEQEAARHLRKACNSNDPEAAGKAWDRWSVMAGFELKSNSELHDAVIEMQNVLFGSGAAGTWSGTKLRLAFQDARTASRIAEKSSPFNELPPLNYPNRPV